MAQNKITKDIEKKISNLAKQMPVTTYGIKKHVFERISDKVVRKTTIGEDLHKVNHKNRMKVAYANGGVDALRTYIKDVAELSQSKIDLAVDL